MNYQQLGDAASVNKAMGVELQASKVHKWKAWRSNESYYRKKYAGGRRAAAFFDWVSFTILDFVWGNGESLLKLLRAIGIALVVISLIDVMEFRDRGRVDSYLHAFGSAPSIFLGALSPCNYCTACLTAIVFIRLIALGLFLSIIIKRYNRR
jgi:hypothetical protein